MRLTVREAEVLGRAELLGDDLHRLVVEMGGAPAKLGIDGAVDAGVEERERDAEHAGVGVAAAKEDAADAGFAQAAEREGVDAVAEFFEDPVAGFGRDHEFALGIARSAGLAVEFSADDGVKMQSGN